MEQFEFLSAVGARKLKHSGRTLFDHLAGVYSELVSQNQPSDICLAGLYHSVYGTNAFKQILIPRDQREIVRQQIGEKAEELVWQFCNLDRPNCFLNGTNTDRDLITIEIANLREQGSTEKAQALVDLIRPKAVRPERDLKAHGGPIVDGVHYHQRSNRFFEPTRGERLDIPNKAITLGGILVMDSAIPTVVCDAIAESLEERKNQGDASVLVDATNGVSEIDKSVRVVKLMRSVNRGKTIRKAMAEMIIRHVEPFFGVEIEQWDQPSLLGYQEGGFYVPHIDGETWENGRWTRIYDRDYSLILFLNDDYTGGELVFPDQQLTVYPRQGRMVAFPSGHAYRHGAQPVTSGCRFQLVTWLTAKGTARTNYPKYSNHLKRVDYVRA